MLQQFLRTASDGWEIALASVRDLFSEGDLHADEVGGDFASEAARLGTALADVHAQLRDAFGIDLVDAGHTAEQMGDRLDRAIEVVPELGAHRDRLRGAYAALADLGKVSAQRIHGDLHLGQTLRTIKGWKLVDFEGEPAKPLAERLLPDSPWRDVAGMLRSFDYAPHAMARSMPEDDPAVISQREHRAEEWAARNKAAFLAAYAGSDLTAEEGTLVAAYVADKTVYECVYEARNRPSWLPIPLAAAARVGTP
jgi:maltokinase